MKREIITLCGSTKFKNEFLQVAKDLTLQGFIVFNVYVFSHHDNINLSQEQKNDLVDIHNQMLDMSNGIFVVNKNGYIGENTKNEIEYVEKKGKHIRYYMNEY